MPKKSFKKAQTKISILQNQNYIELKNLKNGDTWSFTKNSDTASSASISPDGAQVNFGFPHITQVIYPGQTICVSSGWTVSSIPSTSMMHTIPHKGLVESNLISIPQVMTSSGGDLNQVVLNNNPYPVQIMVKSDGSVGLISLDPNTLEENLEFDIGHLIGTVLGVASHILPFL